MARRTRGRTASDRRDKRRIGAHRHGHAARTELQDPCLPSSAVLERPRDLVNQLLCPVAAEVWR